MIEKKPIGKIEKKRLGKIKGRRVVEVPLLFQINYPYLTKENNEEYYKKLTEYNKNLKQWIKNFELKIGKIDKIYLHALTEENIDDLEKLDYLQNKENIYHEIITELIEKGAKLQITENSTLVNESLAWLSNILSPDALEVDFQLFLETIKDRDIYIIKMIEETLKENETALLLMGIEHSFSFLNDIEYIKFRPPVIDEIIKLIRVQ